MKKLTLFLLAFLGIVSMNAQDVAWQLAVEDVTSGSFTKSFTDAGVTINSPFKVEKSGNDYCIKLNSTATATGATDMEAKALAITATAEIESVEMLVTPNSSNNAFDLVCVGYTNGWNSETPAAADYVYVEAHEAIAGATAADAEWVSVDCSEWNAKELRFTRQVKKLEVAGGAQTQYGTVGQTVRVFAIKVTLKAQEPSLKSLTINGVEAIIDQAEKTVTLNFPYGTTPADIDLTDVQYELGGTATTLLPNLDNSTLTVSDANNNVVVYTLIINIDTTAKYTVTFNDGINTISEQVVEGQTVTAPADPTQDLATFMGWFTDEACTVAADFTQPIIANTTFYAKWEVVYSLTADFVAEGSEEVRMPIKEFLDAYNMAYSVDIDDKGGWDNNALYSGYKIKNNNAYIAFRAHANDYVKVEMGYVETGVTITVNGVAQEFTTSKTETTAWEMTLTEDAIVKIVNNSASGKTTTIRKIQIGGEIVLSNEAEITKFVLNGKEGVISGTDISVNMTVIAGLDELDITALTPAITASAYASVSPEGAQDFTNPVQYTVTAQDGVTTQTYTVTVTVENITIPQLAAANVPYTAVMDANFALPEWMVLTNLEAPYYTDYQAGGNKSDSLCAVDGGAYRLTKESVIALNIEHADTVTAYFSATGDRKVQMVNGNDTVAVQFKKNVRTAVTMSNVNGLVKITETLQKGGWTFTGLVVKNAEIIETPIVDNEYLTICESELPFVWRDTIFTMTTQSGEYIFNRVTNDGKDSIVHLNLVVYPTYNITKTAQINESELPYTWDGQVFTQAGSVNVALQSVYGCDSIVTYELTVVATPTPDPVYPTSVVLSETAKTLEIGETLTLTATLAPENVDEDKTAVVWSSSNEAVATVVEGVVTAVAAGEAVITVATVNGLTATCAITVNAKQEPEGLQTITADGVYYVNGVIYNPMAVRVQVYNAVGQLVMTSNGDIELSGAGLYIISTANATMKVISE